MKIKNLVLSVAVALSMATPMASTVVTNAQAAGSITVMDTQKGSVYKVYKVFDATQDGDAVSYTIPNGSNVANSAGFSEIFTITQNGELQYVTPNEGVTSDQIGKWASALKEKGLLDTTFGNPLQTVTEKENGSEVFTGLGTGYYLIDSTSGSPATAILTSVSPHGIVHEKNTTTGWGTGSKKVDGTSYNIGETVNYTITYDNAMNYNGGQKIYQYVLEDTFPTTAVSLDENSIKVTVGETTVTNYEKTFENGVLKVIIPWAKTKDATTDSQSKDDFLYEKTPQKIVITYSGTVLEGATEGENNPNINKAKIYYNETPTEDTPEETAEFFSGEIQVLKVDGDNVEKPLAGAEFILKGTNGFLVQTKDGENISKNEFNGDKATATKFTTDETGKLVITGLKEGSYQLIETKAPSGYNLLPAPKELLVIGGDVSREGDQYIIQSTVENKQGVELPSTGGMGTIAFTVIGGGLVVGSIVTIVAKRRIEAEK